MTFHKDNQRVKKEWDFRKLGKRRMDAILMSRRYMDDPVMIIFMYLIDHSRNIDTLLRKFEKEIQKN